MFQHIAAFIRRISTPALHFCVEFRCSNQLSYRGTSSLASVRDLGLASRRRPVGFPPRDERRLGVIHPGGDALHGRVVQTLRVEHDAGGIAALGARAERGVAEHVRRGDQLGDERLDPARISSRMPRTTSIGWPAGSASTQSS